MATPHLSRAAHLFAGAVVWLRYVIIIFWLLAAAWAVQQPHVDLAHGGSGLRDLAPVDLPAVQTELRAAQAFPVPLHSRTLLVQRRASGFSRGQQLSIVAQARPRNPPNSDTPDLFGGVPLINHPLIAGARPPFDTTAVTYLVFRPNASATARTRQANELARFVRHNQGGEAEVTGAIPARISTAHVLRDALPRLEIITAAVIAVAVALWYQSLLAPLIVLLTVGIAYVMSQSALGVMADMFDRDIPREVEPLLVALLLGVITDYAIFFLSAFQRQLSAAVRPESAKQAARAAISETVPIVLVAALTVAAGCASLMFAQTDFVAAFGPALAITVLVAAAVSLTLVPALISVLGSLLFWPRRSRLRASRPKMSGARVTRLLMHRQRAMIVAIGVAALLLATTYPMMHMRLGHDAVTGLPADDPVSHGKKLAHQGFAAGILSPTVILLEGSHLNDHIPQISKLQDLLTRQPGVAGTLGTATVRDVRRLQQPDSTLDGIRDPLGVAITESGSAARMLVILKHDPYQGRAVETLSRLRERMPTLLRESGLPNTTSASAAGDTAVVLDLVDELKRDMVHVAIGVVLLDLLLLAGYLRSVIAPMIVVGGSILAVGASLGITTFVFQTLLGADGIVFYVPLASIVLLLSLGADYGVFSIGHAWQLLNTHTLEEALISGARRTSRVIAIAGTLLAASFALLSVIPVHAFLQFAVAMASGVLIDTLIVRPILLPAALRSTGKVAMWPRRQRAQ